jgi:sulfatase maturation enzyme AslB (radical SAM superfamily)
VTRTTAPARAWRRAPPRLRAVKVALTERCNQACEYCYQRVRGGSSLGEDHVAAVFDLIGAVGAPTVTVTVTGGEPLLAPQTLAAVLARAGRRQGRRVAVRVLTNGLLLDSAWIARFVAADAELQVSCDGVAEAQMGRSSGSWPVVAGVLGDLRRYDPDHWRRRVSVAMTVTRRNVAHLSRSVAWLLARDVRRIRIAPACEPATGWNRTERTLLAREMARVLEQSVRYQAQTGRVPVVHLRSGPGGPAGRDAPTGATPCGAPDLSALSVAADGRVHGCGVLADVARWHPAPALRLAASALDLGPVGAPDLAARWRRLTAAPVPWCWSDAGLTTNGGACADCRHRPQCLICPAATDAIGRRPAAHCLFERLAARQRRILRESAPLVAALVATGCDADAARRLAASIPRHLDR